MKYKLDYKNAKALCEQVLKEEIDRVGLDVDYQILGTVEYYKSSYFKENLKLSREGNGSQLFEIVFPLIADGDYDVEENNTKRTIVIFVNDLPVFGKLNDVYSLLQVIYHELHHALVDRKPKDDKSYNWQDFNEFVCELEDFCIDYDSKTEQSYNFNPKKFLFEILADMYGSIKAQEYLNKNGIEYDKKKVEGKDKEFANSYSNYNISRILETVIANYPEFIQNSNFKKKFFDVFLNEDGTFKNLDVILSDTRLDKIDREIFEAFLSTKTFLSSVKSSEISESSIKVLNEVLSFDKDVVKANIASRR